MKNFFTLLLVFCLHSAWATNYYFSAVSGDDSRTATQAKSSSTPWKSLSKLNSVFSTFLPGDSILLKRGETFFGSIIVNKSGISGSPITIGAYGTGNKPVITSLISVTSWVSKGNGIYESANALSATTVNVVLLNGAQQEMGRYPNSDAPNKGFLTIESHVGTTSFTDNELTASPNWTGAVAVIRTRRWVIDRDSIISHSGSTITYKAGSRGAQDKYGYFIENSIKTLDKLGEWYYNPSTKKLSVYFGSNNPSSYLVQVPSSDDIIHSESRSYVTFDNLSIKGANTSSINVRYGSHLSVTNCDINFSAQNGIKTFYNTYLLVEGCTITNSNYGGVNMGYNSADYATIRNNKIINSALFPGMGGNGDQQGLGIMSYGNYNIIEYNEIRNTGYNAITFNGHDVTIKNNYIDSFCFVKDDGGGIYAYTGGSTTVFLNRKIIGNIVVNGVGAPNGAYNPWEIPAEGIYMDEGTANVEISGNTIANCSNQGILYHNAHDNKALNNTIFTANNRYVAMSQSANKALIRNNTVNGNIFFSNIGTQTFLYLRSDVSTDLTQFGNFSGNYYARPADNNTATVLSKIRLYESTAAIKSFTTACRFEYNATKTSKTIVLDAAYVDAKNKSYSGSLTLQPYTSVILIRTGSITNVPPAVSITSPAVNATYASPAAVNIAATASDADGKVSKVQFYNGATLLGTDTTSPYTLTWNNVAAGNYTITAKATDNGSLVTTSSAVSISVNAPNVAPTVSITSPLANATLAAPASITIGAAAVDANGTISKVSFYNGSTLLGTDSTSPYSFTWNNVAAGNYTITAKATDNGALVTTSAAIAISVFTPNVAPTVSVINPVANATFTTPTSVTINAAAADANGTVTKVDFYSGATLLGTDSTSPYSFTWNNVPAGNYTVTAKATDNGSLVTTSAAVSFAVQKPVGALIVNITSPVASATFAAPASVTISASAVDTNSTVRKVEFYNRDTLIGTDTASPYTFTWSNVPAGNYVITAKATDNNSLVTISAPVNFSVLAPNVAPSVSFTGIATNISFGSLPSVTISAAASDADGTVTKVDFYNADTLIGTVSASPYILIWNNVQPGIYTITAKATDNKGAVTTSSKVTISVVAPILSLRSSNNTHSASFNTVNALANQDAKSLSVKVFPNPAVNKIQVSVEGLQINNRKANLSIINVSGVIVKNIPVILSGKTIEADISSLSSGMYIVSIATDNAVISKKFLKN